MSHHWAPSLRYTTTRILCLEHKYVSRDMELGNVAVAVAKYFPPCILSIGGFESQPTYLGSLPTTEEPTFSSLLRAAWQLLEMAPNAPTPKPPPDTLAASDGLASGGGQATLPSSTTHTQTLKAVDDRQRTINVHLS